jgi:hypothetical protein
MGFGDWITVLIVIFFVALVYATLYAPTIDMIIPAINTTDLMAQPEQQEINERVVLALNIIPWIFIGGILLWGFITSQRREPDTGVIEFG